MNVIRAYEKKMGIDFIQPMGFEEAGTDPRIAQYYHSSHDKVINQAIKCVFSEEDSRKGFFDYGCGKGKVIYIASKYNFSKLGGVELSPKIVNIAKKNMAHLKINNVDIIGGDAREYTDIDEYDVFYFYNPFPAVVMDVVLENIKASYYRNQRKISLIYFNPVHERCFTNAGINKVNEFSTRIGLRRRPSLPVYIYEIL